MSGYSSGAVDDTVSGYQVQLNCGRVLEFRGGGIGFFSFLFFELVSELLLYWYSCVPLMYLFMLLFGLL